MKQTIIVKRSLYDLKRAPVNIRMHPDKQMKEYIRSVKKHGLLKLPVIDEDNVIWCGNGLYDALLAEGYTECDCILKAGMTETEKRKMMMSENKIFDLGVDDMNMFDRFLAEMSIDDLDIPGYNEELLKSLKADCSDVDEMMSEYGIIDNDKKEAIIKAGESSELNSVGTLNPVTHSAEVSSAEVSSAEDAAGSSVSGQEYVVCPHCGEKIWL